jgi:hypothetical protein
MEIVQVHQYHYLLPRKHVELIRDVRPHGKPVIMGEGNYSGVPESFAAASGKNSTLSKAVSLGYADDSGQTLHDMIWAAAVVESGAMSWWWDGWIHPNNLYSRFPPLVAFADGEDWAPQQLEPASVTVLSGHSLEIYGSAGPAHAYLFLLETDPGDVAGLQLRLNQLDAIAFAVEYWNPYDGTIVSTQYATGGANGLVLNVPAFTRDVAIKVRVDTPMISMQPIALEAQTIVGTDAAGQVFGIRNSGTGTLVYSLSDDADWLQVTPETGDSTGETDDIQLVYDTDHLAIGTHTAAITASDPDAYNSPQTIGVTLTIDPHPADLDRDGDSDQADFGRLQKCLTGPAITQQDSNCTGALIDSDDDVDYYDMDIFCACMSGANLGADPGCLP